MNGNSNKLIPEILESQPFPLREEQWEKAKEILLGSNTKMSVHAAAQAAGVSRAVLLACIERAREPDEGDPLWIRSMPLIFDEREYIIADKLQDELWKRAMGWTEDVKVWDAKKESWVDDTVHHAGDSRLLVRMLEVLDPRYRKTQDKGSGIDVANSEEIRRKIKAELHRLKLEQQDPTLKRNRLSDRR